MTDTERLDWIEKEKPQIHCFVGSTSIFLRAVEFNAVTLRAAIDEAASTSKPYSTRLPEIP